MNVLMHIPLVSHYGIWNGQEIESVMLGDKI